MKPASDPTSLMTSPPQEGKPQITGDDLLAIMRVIGEHDATDSLYFNERPFLNCNDAFFWACGDCEPIANDDLPAFSKACEEAGYDGPLLFIARKRQMRPQGAIYAGIEPWLWPLFDACGEPREAKFGNPIGTEQRMEYREKKNAESLARRHLQSAGPDLLAALKALTDHMRDVMKVKSIKDGIIFFEGVEGVPTIKAARAAIAKAEGITPPPSPPPQS